MLFHVDIWYCLHSRTFALGIYIDDFKNSTATTFPQLASLCLSWESLLLSKPSKCQQIARLWEVNGVILDDYIYKVVIQPCLIQNHTTKWDVLYHIEAAVVPAAIQPSHYEHHWLIQPINIIYNTWSIHHSMTFILFSVFLPSPHPTEKGELSCFRTDLFLSSDSRVCRRSESQTCRSDPFQGCSVDQLPLPPPWESGGVFGVHFMGSQFVENKELGDCIFRIQDHDITYGLISDNWQYMTIL